MDYPYNLGSYSRKVTTTSEEIAITARRVVTFHASQKLKAAVSRATER